jgi:HEAT repeat protein
MIRRTLGILLGVLVLASPVWGDATTKEERTAVLKYGIETEVLDVVKALRQEKNPDFKDLLLDAFDHARTDELKEALVLYFLDLKDPSLEDRALQIVSNPDKKANSVLLNAVSYLTEIKSSKAPEVFAAQMTGKNKVLALACIRSLGTLGATDRVDDLIKLYQDAETDPNYKPDLIWTFGTMKATKAVDMLLKEYDDNESQPLLRKVLLEAFGKIGDDRAWDRIQEALASTNTDLRAAAVATLPSFRGKGDQISLLTSALRDPQVAVRQAAAEAAKTLKAGDLKDLLTYRVKKDPEPRVRVAALRALSAYDDGAATVLGFLGDRKADPTVWTEAMKLSLDQKYPGTFDVLKKLMEEENKDKKGVLAPAVAVAILPQRESFRALLGLVLVNDQANARATALRAVAAGKFTEYEGILRSMEAKDPDPGVKQQAASILKEWGTTPTDPNAKKP